MKLTNKEVDQLTKGEADFIEAASDIFDFYRPRIQKEIFISKYLPMLLSDDPSIFITHWISDFAHHQHGVVDMYDGSVKVYELPPLYISPISKDHVKIPAILNMANAQANLDPSLGQRELDHLLDDGVMNTSSAQNIEGWRDVVIYLNGSEVNVSDEVSKNVWYADEDLDVEEW